MPLTFANGGAGTPGVSVLTGQALLTEIRTTLLAAGWTTTLDEITLNEKLIMNGSSAGTNNSIAYDDDCYVRFEVVDNPGFPELKDFNITGQLAASEASANSSTYTANFLEGADNRVWITADEDSGAICIKGFGYDSRGYHFGFLDRPNPELDSFGWMVGAITIRYTEAQWARSFFGSVDWYNCGDDYSNAGVFSSLANTVPYYTTGDLYTSCYSDGSSQSLQSVSTSNTSYFSYRGQVNGVTNEGVLNPFWYLEGRGSPSAYGSSAGTGIQPTFHFRGLVKHVTGGMLRYPELTLVTDSVSGATYISTGDITFQGMRVE